MESVNDIDVIKEMIERHAANSCDLFVVRYEVYDRIMNDVGSSINPGDELMDDVKLSIDKVSIVPVSKFNKSFGSDAIDFEKYFFDKDSFILIKNLNMKS